MNFIHIQYTEGDGWTIIYAYINQGLFRRVVEEHFTWWNLAQS